MVHYVQKSNNYFQKCYKNGKTKRVSREEYMKKGIKMSGGDMSPTEAWDALGIEPGSSIREIDLAYRNRARKVHPNKGGNEEEFKIINEAHKFLKKLKKEENRAFINERAERQKAERKKKKAEMLNLYINDLLKEGKYKRLSSIRKKFDALDDDVANIAKTSYDLYVRSLEQARELHIDNIGDTIDNMKDDPNIYKLRTEYVDKITEIYDLFTKSNDIEIKKFCAKAIYFYWKAVKRIGAIYVRDYVANSNDFKKIGYEDISYNGYILYVNMIVLGTNRELLWAVATDILSYAENNDIKQYVVQIPKEISRNSNVKNLKKQLLKMTEDEAEEEADILKKIADELYINAELKFEEIKDLFNKAYVFANNDNKDETIRLINYIINDNNLHRGGKKKELLSYDNNGVSIMPVNFEKLSKNDPNRFSQQTLLNILHGLRIILGIPNLEVKY